MIKWEIFNDRCGIIKIVLVLEKSCLCIMIGGKS